MKRILSPLFALLVLTLLLFGCISNHSAPVPTSNSSNLIGLNTTEITIGNTTITAWIANTEQSRETGLMNISNLSERNGMLFVFDEPGVYSFWMKNTLVPLDILFVSSNMTIVNVQTMTPCTQDPCEIYSPPSMVKYAIEVNGGFADEYNITSGDQIVIG